MKIPANGFTHAGKFHADDVFATALLQILRPDIKITRGFVVPDGFDGIVYDVGFGMFDHHQEPRECRPNGVPVPGLFVVPFCKVCYTVARHFIGNEVHL